MRKRFGKRAALCLALAFGASGTALAAPPAGEDAAPVGHTASLARDMGDIAAAHVSLAGEDNLTDEGGLWARYNHRRYKTSPLGSSGGDIRSRTEYDGAIVGMDFARRGRFQGGAAIHYGSGDGHGRLTRNDYDAWGVLFYGSLRDEASRWRLIADAGYTASDNDIDGAGASIHGRGIDVWTAGVRGELSFAAGKTEMVPYVGFRYLYVDPEGYAAGDARVDAASGSLWFLPVGLVSKNTFERSGWRFTLRREMSYVWALGGTELDVTARTPTGAFGGWYDAADGSFWTGSIGLTAAKGEWLLGAGYARQHGDEESSAWYVKAGLSF